MYLLCCIVDIMIVGYGCIFAFYKMHAPKGKTNSTKPEEQQIKVGWTMLREWDQKDIGLLEEEDGFSG